MKRDFELLRWILKQAENCQSGYSLELSNGPVNHGFPSKQLDIGQRNFKEVYEHILLLSDHNLVVVDILEQYPDRFSIILIHRLTMSGHDFLETARDEKRWKQAIKKVSQTGGTVTIGILTQVLAALMKEAFGI